MAVELSKILVAIDGSENANRAAAFAARIARGQGAVLILLFVHDRGELNLLAADTLSATRIAEIEIQKARDAFHTARLAIGPAPPLIREETVVGRAADAIVSSAQDLLVELVVVGSRGRSRITELLAGSVAEYVLHHAHCPVTVVR
jgi:nucleotide-binding universal stress UspA family protein